MKVGEIIFHYSTGRKIPAFYFSESERTSFIQNHKDAAHYEIIPYEGQGMPNYIDTKNKTYRAALRESTNDYYHYISRNAIKAA